MSFHRRSLAACCTESTHAFLEQHHCPSRPAALQVRSTTSTSWPRMVMCSTSVVFLPKVYNQLLLLQVQEQVVCLGSLHKICPVSCTLYSPPPQSCPETSGSQRCTEWAGMETGQCPVEPPHHQPLGQTWSTPAPQTGARQTESDPGDSGTADAHSEQLLT